MLYNTLLSLTVLMFCLSLFLVHRASILENDFRKLKRDIILQLNHTRFEGVNGKMAKMSKTREDLKSSAFPNGQSSVKISSNRKKREEDSCRAPTSFLQLTANTNKQPLSRGNLMMIPWTISAQQRNTISTKENRIVVQVDGYYLVFGQVLFEDPNSFMGYVIQKLSPATGEIKSTELLHCVQKMPEVNASSTCYTSGIVHLHQDDELELVIPDRPQPLISLDPETTFFGVIHVN